jgi:hypothetical protein
LRKQQQQRNDGNTLGKRNIVRKLKTLGKRVHVPLFLNWWYSKLVIEDIDHGYRFFDDVLSTESTSKTNLTRDAVGKESSNCMVSSAIEITIKNQCLE